MEKRKIKETGVEVTPIMFGTSGLGDMPETYRYSVDEDRALATVRAIFDGPVNCLDTSNVYGFGNSEKRIGKVIRERGGLPEGFVISTKLDRDVDTGRFDAAQARRSLEQSLERLGVDRVQILHLHDPEHCADLGEITGKGGSLDELVKMKEEGLADAIGLAMGRVDMMTDILKGGWPFDAIVNHNRYTLLNRAANEMFHWAHERGIAILNAAPYASGVLAKGADTMPVISYVPADEEALEPVRAIEEVCARGGIETGAVALQFSMNDRRITSTIVGVTKPERIEQTIGWAEAEIPDEVWAALGGLDYSTEDPEADRDYAPG
ncbi:MAG: aldo/keto reductase [Boseongicola sp.]|nr:aldo/keto reductase [Silicimonas sp.]NNF90008.1 aldo/keto reductase [Boseongicola sp.]